MKVVKYEWQIDFIKVAHNGKPVKPRISYSCRFKEYAAAAAVAGAIDMMTDNVEPEDAGFMRVIKVVNRTLLKG